VNELRFEVLGARAEPYAAGPTVVLRLRIDSAGDEPIHAMVLRCQLRIEPQRRRYDSDEEERLYGMFGVPAGWGESLRPFLWTHAVSTVSGFTRSTEIDLHVPCTYDMEVASTRYLHALGEGDIPVILLFSGSVFSRGERGFVVEPVAWHAEAAFRLPVKVWREAMDALFAGSGWLRLRRDVLDGVARHQARLGLASLEEAVVSLLALAEDPVAG
jgi:hypothetical protein